MLVVCLGYGVVRPTLGNVAYRVMALGLVCVVPSNPNPTPTLALALALAVARATSSPLTRTRPRP